MTLIYSFFSPLPHIFNQYFSYQVDFCLFCPISPCNHSQIYAFFEYIFVRMIKKMVLAPYVQHHFHLTYSIFVHDSPFTISAVSLSPYSAASAPNPASASALIPAPASAPALIPIPASAPAPAPAFKPRSCFRYASGVTPSNRLNTFEK